MRTEELGLTPQKPLLPQRAQMEHGGKSRDKTLPLITRIELISRIKYKARIFCGLYFLRVSAVKLL